MICKNCHTENPEEAVFCMHCGVRLDGKLACKHCGTLNDGAALYCMHCGTRIAAPSPSAPAGVPKPERTSPKRPIGKYLSLAGEACVLAAAFFAFVFVFCIALTGSFAVTSESGAQRVAETTWFYDYFGKVYKDISDALSAYPKDTEPLAFALYLPAVLGTSISVGALIAVPVLFTFACVRFVNGVRGKTEKSCFPLAAACLAVYIFAAGAILALNQAAVGSADSSAEVCWNGATVAGVVLGALFFAMGAALSIASKGKHLLCFPALFRCGAALLGSAILTVALVFVCRGQIEFSSANSGTNAGVCFNAMLISSFLGIAYIQNQQLPFPAVPLTAAAVSLFAQIALIALFLVVLIALWQSALSQEERPPVVFPAVCIVLAVVGLVMDIVWVNTALDYLSGVLMNLPDTINISYAAPIVVTVMSVLLLAAGILSRVLPRAISQSEGTSGTVPPQEVPSSAPVSPEEFEEESFDGYENQV